MDYTTLPTDVTLQKVVKSLETNNMYVQVAENNEEAKKMALRLIPDSAEVMTMTSATLDTLGISEIINTSSKYNSVRNQLMKMDREKESGHMQKLGSAPEYAIGSVHAVTEDGHILIASGSGSQLPAYAYGAQHVIWVIGAQKIVKNIDEGVKRIYEHSLLLENERVKVAYGIDHSNVNKILIVNQEGTPNRISIILVKQVLGY